jgi:DNA topoisomerase-1
MKSALSRTCRQKEKYTLVIAEKPDSARRIAEALDKEGTPARKQDKGVPYYESNREKKIITVPALGHLYTIVPDKKGGEDYPVFEYKWVPRHVAERKAKRTRTWIEIISKLGKNADVLIDACDYDVEGSLIGYNVLRHACDNREKQAQRMKYSTLTRQELEESYEHLLPHLDFAQIEAGLTRHEVDWLYGINLTRALTSAIKKTTGRYFTMSTGRVQGPTLKFIAEREKQIRTHVPEPFWQIYAEVEIQDQTFPAPYEKQPIHTKKEAEDVLNACTGRNGLIDEVYTETIQQMPPFPFNLGALQREAYRLFGYTPRHTLQIGQHLYLDTLISYPRTDSQKLPSSINYKAILANLGKISKYKKAVEEILTKAKLRPNEGRKEDPAHPAIFPTGNLPDINIGHQQANILNLIIHRFLAVFGEPATEQTMNARIIIGNHSFMLVGKHIIEKGWKNTYLPYVQSAENPLPPIRKGDEVKINQITLESKFTAPRHRYNPSTLLKQMEKSEIGTKATRADIIQTLYNRKYMKNETITATDVGFAVVQTLEKYCPQITSIKLTRQMENKMSRIQKKEDRREDIIEETTRLLKPILEEIKRNETKVAENIGRALRKALQDRSTVGTCLSCKTGKLTIVNSKKTRKRFIGCSNYYKTQCRTTFPLPQSGVIQPLYQTCSRCGWPEIMVRPNGKRQWKLCINPSCPKKQGREEKHEMRNLR